MSVYNHVTLTSEKTGTLSLHAIIDSQMQDNVSLQVAALYMCTRLIVNITQAYIPMYTLETLSLHKVGVK